MRAPAFFGVVSGGRIKLDNKPGFMEYLSGLEKKRVRLVIDEYVGLRSERQNAYYWAVVVPIIAEHLGYTSDEMHTEIKKKFGVEKTSVLKKKEFGDFVDRVVRWASIEFNVAIPDPESVEF